MGTKMDWGSKKQSEILLIATYQYIRTLRRRIYRKQSNKMDDKATKAEISRFRPSQIGKTDLKRLQTSGPLLGQSCGSSLGAVAPECDGNVRIIKSSFRLLSVLKMNRAQYIL